MATTKKIAGYILSGTVKALHVVSKIMDKLSDLLQQMVEKVS